MQVRHRADEADALLAAGNSVIRGWAICPKSRLRHHSAIMRFDRAFCFEDGDEIFLIEHFASADRHHLNETQDQIPCGSEFDQWNQLVFIAAAHENAIQFDLVKSGCGRRCNSIEDLWMKIAPGDPRINMWIQRIKGNIDGADPRFAQSYRHRKTGLDPARQQSSVGRKADVAQAGNFRQLAQ